MRTYDEAGNVKTETDARGVTVTYTWDALNRLTKKQSSTSGSPVWTYEYDYCRKGSLCMTLNNSVFNTYHTWDAWGRPQYRIQNLGSNNSISFVYSGQLYDSTGRAIQMIYPTGRTVTTTYDAQGRISQMTTRKTANDPDVILADTFVYSYPFAGPVSFRYGNDQWHYQSRNQDYQPWITVDGPRIKIHNYDAANNLTALWDWNNSQITYAYDATGRLVSALDTATNSFGSLTWAYDKNGNRQSETRNAGTMPYVYSPTGSNRLFQTGSTSRYKTANGNTQSIGTTTFTYDGFNRLATAQTAAETTTYTYNALGERIRKQNQNGLATAFHYGANGELLFERDQAGNTKEYVWLDGRPLARIDNGTTIYAYHVDHLGTPQMMSDDTGSLVWKATYEPFGKVSISPASTVENNLRFPGQYFDRETGLHYNYYRDYDPTTGRYPQVDPIGIAGGLNVYVYGLNNPLTYTDPLGLAPYNDPMNQIANRAAGLPPNANLPPQMQCKKVCKAKAKVCVGFVELEASSSPDKWAGGYAGLRLIPGLSAQSGLECSIECGDPTGWNLKATATAGAGIGVTGNASIGFDGASTGGGLASGSIWGISLPSPGVGYRF